jgi:hypothetical protein
MDGSNRPALLDEIDAQIPAADFETECFPTGLARVTIDLTAEVVEQVTAAAEKQGWPKGEAFVALLALGFGALEEERARALMEQNDQPARDELDLLVRRMRQLEMQYAVMKRRSWDFLKAYQSASLADGALRNQVAGLSSLVPTLCAERDELRRRVMALEAERERWQRPTSDEEESALDPADEPLWRRLIRLLGRRREQA